MKLNGFVEKYIKYFLGGLLTAVCMIIAAVNVSADDSGAYRRWESKSRGYEFRSDVVNNKYVLTILKNKKKIKSINNYLNYYTNGKKIFYTVRGENKNTLAYMDLAALKEVELLSDNNVILKGVSGNAESVFYIKEQNSKNTIYKLDVKTKKSTKLVSGKDYQLFDVSLDGKYLYYGVPDANYQEEFLLSYTAYSLNLSTGKKKRLVDGVGKVTPYKNKVITFMEGSDVGSVPLNIFNKDGTDKRNLGTANSFEVKNDMVYMRDYVPLTDKNPEGFEYFSYNIKTKRKSTMTENAFYNVVFD